MKTLYKNRETINPFDVIEGITLRSSKNKEIRISMIGTKFINDKQTKSYLMDEFQIFDYLPEKYNDKDKKVFKILTKIIRFGKYSNNKDDMIKIMIDAYKSNKKDLSISFKTTPKYRDSYESSFLQEYVNK